MTIKKAIGIGLLGATIIGLLAVGIKTNSFNKENLKPKTLTRSNTAIRVNADNVLPISTKWLLNTSQPLGSHNEGYVQLDQQANFTSWYTGGTSNTFQNAKKRNYSRIKKDYTSSNAYALYYYVNINGTPQYSYTLQSTINAWTNTSQRIVNFENEPTGNLYTYLSKNAQPTYNNDILLVNKSNIYDLDGRRGIQQIRKSNIIIEETNYLNGAFINESAPIDIYLDAGITHLYINGTDYINNLDTQLNITNDDIIITGNGTTTGQYWKTFRINYFNTRPPIEPQPYPDASGKVTEIVDIRSLMLQILTMPFTFITQAFDVTFWPGTPYEFNISNFIMAIISIASILFIIKLFTSGFSIIGNFTNSRIDGNLKKSQTKLNKAKTKEIESKTPKKE